MKVEILSEVIDRLEVIELLTLVTIVRKGQHLLWAKSEVRQRLIKTLKGTETAHSLACKLANEVETALRDGERRVPTSTMKCNIKLIAGEKSDWASGRLTIHDAIFFLTTPLLLLVENRHSDGAFLRAFMGKRHREELEKLLGEGRVRFENGGGLTVMLKTLKSLRPPLSSDELENVKEMVLAAHRRLEKEVKEDFAHRLHSFLEKADEEDFALRMTPLLWRERLRLWVLFDRDKDVKAGNSHLPSIDSAAVQALCSSMTSPWAMAHHQHVRRAIENYLPQEALQRWAGDDQELLKRVDAYWRSEQKAFLNVKKELGSEKLAEPFYKLTGKEIDGLEKVIESDRAVMAFRERLINSIREHL